MDASDEAEDSANIRLYSEQLQSHGTNVCALGWSSERTQQKRFEVLASLLRLENASVLDVGCGFGDLFHWLKCRGFGGSYTGVDLTGDMVGAAREKYPAARFVHGNILGDRLFDARQFEYVVASGIFTFRVGGGVDYVYKMAHRMFDLSSEGIGFNCLSAWGENTEADELTVVPEELLAVCRQKITPWLTLRHDYHPGDFTVSLYRNQFESES